MSRGVRIDDFPMLGGTDVLGVDCGVVVRHLQCPLEILQVSCTYKLEDEGEG